MLKLPDYRRSTASIPATILHHFGISFHRPPLPDLQRALKGADKVVFFFLDGLGVSQLKQLPKKAFLRAHALPKPITAVFPSTTAASAATFSTGLTPQEHGILGYTLYLPEARTTVNMLGYVSARTHKPIRIRPRTFFPFPTVYQRLRKAKVTSTILGPAELKNTTFSRMLYPGSTYVPCKDLTHLFKHLRKLLQRPGKMYIHCYTPEYDTLCHEYGPGAVLPRLYLASLNNAFARFARTTRARKAVLVISADHGQVFSDPKRAVIYSRHKRLAQALISVAGEARMNYLYCKRGKQKFVEHYLRRFKQCILIPSDEALASGLFGTGAPYCRTRERLGDFVVLWKRNALAFWEPPPMLGHHGGMSTEEMLVPLIVHRFRS